MTRHVRLTGSADRGANAVLKSSYRRARATLRPLRAAFRGLGDSSFRIARRDDEHLRLLLAFVLRADSNCVDVGAHAGDITRDILHYAPQGQHIAYEPLPHMADKLGAMGVSVRQVALSNYNGVAEFTYVRSRPGHSGFRERAYPGKEQLEKIEVDVCRLDDDLPAHFVPSLIKIDVEGAELEVLQGAVSTITRYQPLVVFEHGKGASDYYGTTPGQVHELFLGAGMRIFDLDGRGPHSRAEFERVYEANERWNFIARP